MRLVGFLQPLDLRLVQMDVEGGDGLLQMVHAGRADDRGS